MEKVLDKIKNFKIISPEDVFRKIGNWLDANKKTAFLTAIIVGFITHAILLSVMIMSPDGLWNALRYSAGQVETESGRWAINIIDTFRKNIAMPTITTTFSIIITGINAIFIVDFLNLKSRTSVIFTSIFLAVSPCLTIILLYSYTADAYCFAFLFATLSAWCIYREKHRIWGAIGGAVFTMLTLALYQSYIGAIIGLCILKPIIDILKGEKTYKQIFINIGISMLIVIVGMGLYYVSEQIALNIYNTKLSSYGGASNIGVMNTLRNLKGSIKKMYLNFLNFFFGGDIVNNPSMSRHTFYKILFTAEGLALLFILITRKTENTKKKIIDAVLVVVGILGLPAGLNFIVLIAPETVFYPLNTAQLILILPFMLAILENFEMSKGVIFKWVSFVMCFIIAVTYYLTANCTYLAVRLRYNQAYAITVRMVQKIEDAEGYEQAKPWLICGIPDTTNTPQVSEIYFMTIGGFVNGPIFHGNYWGSQETWRKFLQIFMGIQPNFCSIEDYYKICGTEEFKQMKIFPEENSVKEINGVMVVKFTENVPM